MMRCILIIFYKLGFLFALLSTFNCSKIYGLDRYVTGSKPSNRVCSKDGWCWYNPLVGVNSIRDAWFNRPNDIWAVGDNGSIVHWNGVQWISEQSGTKNHLFAIWASSSNSESIWAVGDKGVILHRINNSWQQEPARNSNGTLIEESLYGICGLNQNDIWVVGAVGSVLHWNGSQWTSTSISQEQLNSVWCYDSENIWVVGNKGFISKRKSGEWIQEKYTVSMPTDAGSMQVDGSSNLKSIWGVNPNQIWALGEKSTILVFDGNSWTSSQLLEETSFEVRSIYGSNSKNIWIVGDPGIVFQKNPNSFSIVKLPADHVASQEPLSKVWVRSTDETGASVDEAWAVTAEGNLLLIKDAVPTWQTQVSITKKSTSLRGVWGSDAKNVWAVGDNGTILKWDGASWSSQQNSSTKGLFDIWGSDSKNVWAVGAESTILRWNGESWVDESIPLPNQHALRAIWGADPNHVWAVGGGFIVRRTSEGWAIHSRDDTRFLMHIWGRNADDIWAVGSHSPSDPETTALFMHWNGQEWTQWPSSSSPGLGKTPSLRSVWGTENGQFWVTNDQGRLFRMLNDQWQLQFSEINNPRLLFQGVVGLDANHLWGIGYYGTIAYWDGNTWMFQDCGTPNTSFYDIWASHANDVWVVGDSGAILRYNPH